MASHDWCVPTKGEQSRGAVAESLRWLTHVTNKGQNKLARFMVALGPIIGPRKPDCTCSCVCVCACTCTCGLVMSHPLWPLLLGSHRIPVSFQELVPFIRGLQGASVLSNTKQQESMRLSQGVSTLVLFFPLGHVKGFCYMEIKMSSITTTHLAFSIAHSKEFLKYSVNEWVKNWNVGEM